VSVVYQVVLRSSDSDIEMMTHSPMTEIVQDNSPQASSTCSDKPTTRIAIRLNNEHVAFGCKKRFWMETSCGELLGDDTCALVSTIVSVVNTEVVIHILLN
jgi:hypothetical protein